MKSHEEYLLAVARGRLSSMNWRLSINAVFAVAAVLILHSFWVASAWYATVSLIMFADLVVSRRYVAAKTHEERLKYAPLLVAGTTVSIAGFVSMAPMAILWGGIPGRELGFIIAVTSLFNVMVFLFQSRWFMALTAIPAMACLLALPFLPIGPSPASPTGSAIGVALGVAAFLVLAARAALNNQSLFVRIEAAKQAALMRQIEADARRAEAERANDAKSEFMTMMTHELRTPLNVVINYSEMIGEDMQDAGQDAAVADAAKINSSARHLLGLIDQILDVTNMDSGRVQLNLGQVDIREMIASVVYRTKDMVEAGGNRLSVNVAADVETVSSDEGRLASCVEHLLANAARFTSNGDIVIAANLAGPNQEKVLRISVADTGSGMSEDEIVKALQPFTQINGSMTRTQGGMGLGLSITESTVKALGGSLSVESKRGVGSKFTVTLPARSDDLLVDQ